MHAALVDCGQWLPRCRVTAWTFNFLPGQNGVLFPDGVGTKCAWGVTAGIPLQRNERNKSYAGVTL